MKLPASIVIVTSLIIVPAYGFAQQTSAPLTRAEVRADLAQVEQAGYSPSTGEDNAYPADVQAAEAKNDAGHPTLATASVGGAANLTESGRRTGQPMSDTCVGPAGFCIPYFGS